MKKLINRKPGFTAQPSQRAGRKLKYPVRRFWEEGKGFTLIELLVVITIIGLLAGMILVSLSSPKTKARDVRIQVYVNQMRTIAGLIYGDKNEYNLLCSGNDINTTLGAHNYINEATLIRADLEAQIGSLTPGFNIACQAEANSYCLSVEFKTPGKGFYCIDSTGLATTTSSLICAEGNKACRR